MANKDKKMHFGKRLWHAITEPIPDDDEQKDEEIPLAYDLKTSTATSEASAASSAVSAPQSQAQSAIRQSQAAPAKAKATSATTQASATASKSQAGSVTSEAKSATPQSQKASTTRSQARATREVTPKAPKSAAKAAASTTVIEPDVVAESAKHRRGQVAKAPAPRSAVDPAAADSTISVANSQASVATNRQSQAAKPVTSGEKQPVISVAAVERSNSKDETPPLPLSREELYGDQQPNGGSEAPRQTSIEAADEPLSRLARHGEAKTESPVDETPTTNPHLKKKAKGSRPHQKPKRRNGKLVATGVGLLVIAALGAFFMYTHAKTTETAAKTNAEAVVKTIYTSAAQRDLRASASNAKLNQLQTYIDEMKQSETKTSLQAQHDSAAKMLKIRQRVQGLYTSDKLIKEAVTMDNVTFAQTAITNSGLKTKKPYFAKRYTKQLTAAAKIVKPVRQYDATYRKLYTNKNRLKNTVSTSDLDVVIKHLKPYRTKSELAAKDYKRLTADRKTLAKKEQSAATSAANAVSSSATSYSDSEESSSSSTSSSSYSAYSSATSSTDYGTDTDTSSANSSSSTYGGGTTTSDSSSSTYGGNTTTGNDTTTGTGTGTSQGTTY